MVAVQKGGAKKSRADEQKHRFLQGIVSDQRHGTDDEGQQRGYSFHETVQLDRTDPLGVEHHDG